MRHNENVNLCCGVENKKWRQTPGAAPEAPPSFRKHGVTGASGLIR